jgi:hypothetical protein
MLLAILGNIQHKDKGDAARYRRRKGPTVVHERFVSQEPAVSSAVLAASIREALLAHGAAAPTARHLLSDEELVIIAAAIGAELDY